MTHEVLDADEWQRQYDEAAEKLDAAATPAITARDDGGKFTAAPAPAATPPVAAPAAAPAVPAAATAPAEAPPGEPATAESIAELTARLERTEKSVRDTQAWGTRMAQEAAALRRQQETQQREASRPAILDENPELADAIRFVATDPAPQHQAEARATAFQSVIEKAHPDAFATDMPEELQTSIAKAWQELGDAAQDPLEVVRVITQEKIAFTERQTGKRFTAELARQQEKSAMSVPGTGKASAVVSPQDAQLVEAQRISNMTDR
ncbi:MAG: hypothetical protein M3Y65_24760 [Pseudomonadota bacterium]|nr:hypothetical protein [Pseudomonadota bacterium]